MEGIKRRRPRGGAQGRVIGRVYDLVLLDVLRAGPGYAYEMLRRIDEQSGHAFQWREGTVYRALHALERRGLVTGRWEGPPRGRRRRYYELTARGRQQGAARRQAWQSFRTALDRLLTR